MDLPDQVSRIAVLWEGGYPEFNAVPEQLRGLVGRHPMKPMIIVHDLAGWDAAGRIREPLRTIFLDVPLPGGETPLAQRFRATDLVWNTLENHQQADPTLGFIVLLSSENSPPRGVGAATEYKLKILQRFDMAGNPVGEPLSLFDICRECLQEAIEGDLSDHSPDMHSHLREVFSRLEDGDWENINWEGLDWFVEGESLILIYDKWPKDPPFALVVDLPENWK